MVYLDIKNSMQQAEAILKKEFGPDWRNIIQELGTEDLRHRAGKQLTSFVAYLDRGEGGSSQWRGNCSSRLVEDVIKYVMDCNRYCGQKTDDFKLLDPMSGSGSSKAAADRIGISSIMYDLNPEPAVGKGGWNALRDDVEDDADLILLHPPYHDIIPYSGSMWGAAPHPDDLSHCKSYREFIEKLNYVIKKLYLALRRNGRLAILVGDIRRNGQFYSIQHDIMTVGALEAFVVKGQYNCKSDSRIYRKPFIPIVTEYLLLFKKEGELIVSFSRRVSGSFNMMMKDNNAVTWNHLVRNVMESMGGTAKADDLYTALAGHPKAQGQKHYRDRIRAVIQEHPDTYQQIDRGVYALKYAA